MEQLLEQVHRINELSLTEAGNQQLIDELLSIDSDLYPAIVYATQQHEGQVRKYITVPYVSHCLAVARIASLVTNDLCTLTAALLHDTVEDTSSEIEDIEQHFGHYVGVLVENLTDVEDNEAAKAAAAAFKASNHGLTGRKLRRRLTEVHRAEKKRIDREHTANALPAAQTVKLADLTHNTFSIATHDPDFAKVYLPEKALLLDVLTRGDDTLRLVAIAVLREGLFAVGASNPLSAVGAMGTFIE